MKNIQFTKMHGCGNDYIYFDCTKEMITDPAALSIRLSDRHKGVGGDGIILICPSTAADFRMRIFNADGSEGAMCGNGIRCVAKFIYDKGLKKSDELRIEAGIRSDAESIAGNVCANDIKTIQLSIENGIAVGATVDMGIPEFVPAKIPVKSNLDIFKNIPVEIAEKTWNMTCVSMGNPHAVVYVDDPSALNLSLIGPEFEHNALFPDRVNTEFVHVHNRHEVTMRVWERGSGETMACGTGACASAVASIINGYTDNEVTVHLLGGDLNIKYDRTTDHVFMTGPAETVFEGSLCL